MRPLNLDNVKAVVEGEYSTLPAGAYACVINDVKDNEKKEYLTVLFDITVGEHEGYFSEDFYKDKPWAHQMILSYKDTALGMLKGRLETITACNPGFDAVAAINAGRFDMLKDKAVGIVFRQEEYFDKKTEEFKLGSPRAFRFCTLQDIEDGKNTDPKPHMLDEKGKIDALERAGIANPKGWLLEHDDSFAGSANVVTAAATDDSDLPF